MTVVSNICWFWWALLCDGLIVYSNWASVIWRPREPVILLTYGVCLTFLCEPNTIEQSLLWPMCLLLLILLPVKFIGGRRRGGNSGALLGCVAYMMGLFFSDTDLFWNPSLLPCYWLLVFRYLSNEQNRRKSITTLFRRWTILENDGLYTRIAFGDEMGKHSPDGNGVLL